MIKDIVQGKCAHLPTPIPPHLKVFFSNDVATLVFCSSLAESQIFLKVLVYDFNVINQTKISVFFLGPQGARQCVYCRYVNKWIYIFTYSLLCCGH